MGEGWIKLHRQFLSWQWYKDSNTMRVFLHLILVANNVEGKFKGIIIKRGQHLTSVDILSKTLGLSTKQVRIALDKLKKGEDIGIERASNGTMITICKYDIYQQKEKPKGKQEGNESDNAGANQGQSEGNKQDIEDIKEIKEVIIEKKSVFKIPTVDEIKSYCLERKNTVDPIKFFNHYESNGWMVGKSKMKNWQAAIRTWENNLFNSNNNNEIIRRGTR